MDKSTYVWFQRYLYLTQFTYCFDFWTPVNLIFSIWKVPFHLHGPLGVLRHLKFLIETKGSAVLCVAEGAGQVCYTTMFSYQKHDGPSLNYPFVQLDRSPDLDSMLIHMGWSMLLHGCLETIKPMVIDCKLRATCWWNVLHIVLGF